LFCVPIVSELLCVSNVASVSGLSVFSNVCISFLCSMI
jgi:hypothetical protein